MPEPLLNRLSPRQRDVLELIARGLTNRDIARVLCISPATVRTHITPILAVLDVTNRTEAALAYQSAAATVEHMEAKLRRPALAVFPFTHQSPRHAALHTVTFGITQELITRLGAWRWFPVIVAPSNDPVAHAAFAVRGSALAIGGIQRVTARLEDCATAEVLWTASYDIPQSSALREIDAVTHKILAHVQPALVEVVGRQSQELPHPDPTSWMLAYAALRAHRTRTRAGNAQARDLGERAIAGDARNVVAWYGRGLAMYDAMVNQWSVRAPALAALEHAAERCVDLAPDAPEGHLLRARLQIARAEPELARAPLNDAIVANPSFSMAHSVLGQIDLLAGDVDSGLTRIRQAERLGPDAHVAGGALAFFAEGAYKEALIAANRVLAVRPEYAFAHVIAVASAVHLGDKASAAHCHARLKRTHPDYSGDLLYQWFGARRNALVEQLASGLHYAERL